MAINFKIYIYWIFTICLLLGSLSSFGQEFNDKEIGFDIEKATIELKQKGFTNPEELSSEIKIMREMHVVEYLAMKKNEEEVLQKINLQQSPKRGLLKATAITDIPLSEKNALLALYNSTNGANWKNKQGWDFNKPVTSWDGVTGWYGLSVTNGHLTYVNLENNNLSGYLPAEIAQLEYLTYFNVNINKIIGGIPLWIGQLADLEILYLNQNELTGNIPLEIFLLKKLRVLDLRANKLTGEIPRAIGQLTELHTLNLSSNELTGPIPSEIGQLVNLGMLALSYNELTGGIPSEIGKLSKLTLLFLHSNILTGSIPLEITQLVNLKEIYLYTNKLSGSIPKELGLLSNLINLSLNYNQFTGEIPKDLGNLSKLKTLYLSVNQLSGTVPPEIYKLLQLEALHLGENQLTGTISRDINKLRNLTFLAYNNNKFSGIIPSEIGQLTKLNSLFLHGNQFSGSIPQEISQLTNLTVAFNLAYNQLEGPIPNLDNIPLSCTFGIYGNKFRFIDLISQYPVLNNRMKFTYNIQKLVDVPKTINSGIGKSITMTMYEDNRYLPEETYQWYKNGKIISGATSRQYVITNTILSDAGTYYCEARHPILSNYKNTIDYLVLKRATITLTTGNCTVVGGTIKTDSEKFYTKTESVFSFQTTTPNLAYTWSIISAEGERMETKESEIKDFYFYNFTKEGNYTITLLVTDTNGCITTFTKNITVINRYCAKEAINFAFETSFTNLNYIWTSTNASGTIVDTVTNTTGLYTFIPELQGEYDIKLTVGGIENCETLFSKKIIVESCLPLVSCVRDNIHAPEIIRLFSSLINKLVSTPNGTDANTYAYKEIAALSPYVINSKAKIYNFSNTSSALSFSFSDASIGNDVQLPKSLSGSIMNIDLSKYTDALAKNIVTINYSNGTNNTNGYVRNINFCVPELSCVSHVAIVLDESGSIDENAANKIKKQLKSFILQQALTNDSIGANIYISLTGMSDSDDNMRTDFIPPTKLTNTPASLNRFNAWIDDFGKRNGKAGISASSDYWRSGLEGALGYSMKPNLVIMITDGCQTADVGRLKETMKKFNNAPGSNPNLPHLYVVGLEKGFYVDETFFINKFSSPTENPNSNTNSLVNTVTTHLSKSLKFLLELPDTQFPKSDINQFDKGTYYGHADFYLLGADETYFSDKLADSKIVCGEASIKNFCDDCLSFKPEPGKEYVLSAWVKEERFTQVKTYENPAIKIIFYNRKEALDSPAYRLDSLSVKASGNIIDGWQRIVQKFKIPEKTITIGIQLENNSSSIPVYFDDIRIHPLQGSVKSFVYDPETFKLMSELDENNYSTFYEYDNEGGLVRVKKETEKGIKTIQETRSGNMINTNP
jgi:Leucine-rich repeat (LRR) protein